jgi:DNA-binding transcriptional LysR family regulator
MACVPAAHALARRRKVSLLELRDEPFVLFSRRASPDYHTRIVEMCGALGFQPKVRHEARHWLSVVALVAQGMGVSVVPAPLQRSGISGALFKPLLQDVPPSPVFAAWKAGSELPVRAQFLQRVLAAR